MQLLRPGPSEAEAALRAMRQLAAARGELGAASRNLLAAAQRQLLHTDIDIDSLRRSAPTSLRHPSTTRRWRGNSCRA
jgi:hypothetical protein